MVKEAYCSFEVAKLLKEKGFDIPTMFVWYEHTPFIANGNFNNKPSMDFIYLTDNPYDERFIRFSNNDKIPDYIFGNVYSCPTLQMACRWLREVHNLCVVVDRTACGYIYLITRIPSGTDIVGDAYNGDDEDSSQWTTWEGACEAGIMYCVKNLI